MLHFCRYDFHDARDRYIPVVLFSATHIFLENVNIEFEPCSDAGNQYNDDQLDVQRNMGEQGESKTDTNQVLISPIITKSKAKNRQAAVVKKKPESNIEAPVRVTRQKARKIFNDCKKGDMPLQSLPKTVLPFTRPDADKMASSDIIVENSNGKDDCIVAPGGGKNGFDTVSIDRSDKKRFISILENFSALSKATASSKVESLVIESQTVLLPGNIPILLSPSDEMELYIQDVNSVAKMMKGMKNKCNRKNSEF